MVVQHKNVTVVPIYDEPGHSYVFLDGEKKGIVGMDMGFISYGVFCYENGLAPYKNAAHFIWTMYYSENWEGIVGIMLDPITDLERIAWQQENCK